MDNIIVSRHPAAIEFIARELGGHVQYEDDYSDAAVLVYDGEEYAVIEVIAQATAEDVTDKHVYGNLPLRLAALAAKVTVVEFEGDPPRGQEYSLAEMDAAGGRPALLCCREDCVPAVPRGMGTCPGVSRQCAVNTSGSPLFPPPPGSTA